MSDSTYWFLVASRASWRRLRTESIWAFSDRYKKLTRSIKNGDMGVVFLRRESRMFPSALAGSVMFCGKSYRISGTEYFDEHYPIRFPVRITSATDAPVPFRPLVGGVFFIKNKSNWGGYLQGLPAKRIDKEDYDFLAGSIKWHRAKP